MNIRNLRVAEAQWKRSNLFSPISMDTFLLIFWLQSFLLVKDTTKRGKHKVAWEVIYFSFYQTPKLIVLRTKAMMTKILVIHSYTKHIIHKTMTSTEKTWTTTTKKILGRHQQKTPMTDVSEIITLTNII